MHAQFMQSFPGIGEFIGRRDQSNLLIFPGYTSDIVALAIKPGRFWLRISIGAAIYYVSHTLAKFLPDFAQPRQASLILDSIVEQCGDGHVFITAIFNNDGGNSQQVPNVRPLGALTNLTGVNAGCITQSENESFREDRYFPRFGQSMR